MPNGVCSRRIEMDYICLVYVDENRLASLPRAERDTLLAKTCDYRQALITEQHYQWGQWLPSARLATTLRHRDGGLRLRDGAAVPGDQQSCRHNSPLPWRSNRKRPCANLVFE